MVTSPPKTSTMMRAEVASVVTCGSIVGGSTKSCTRRVVSMPALPPSPDFEDPASSPSGGASVGAAVGSGVAVPGLDSPPQAATKRSAVNARIMPIHLLATIAFIPTVLMRPSRRAKLYLGSLYRGIVDVCLLRFQCAAPSACPTAPEDPARYACNGVAYLLALKCVASVAEWLRRLSVAQEITGSNPVARPKSATATTEWSSPRPLPERGNNRMAANAPVAQWIEHWASDPGVAGSSPARRATSSPTAAISVYSSLYAGFLCPDSCRATTVSADVE